MKKLALAICLLSAVAGSASGCSICTTWRRGRWRSWHRVGGRCRRLGRWRLAPAAAAARGGGMARRRLPGGSGGAWHGGGGLARRARLLHSAAAIRISRRLLRRLVSRPRHLPRRSRLLGLGRVAVFLSLFLSVSGLLELSGLLGLPGLRRRGRRCFGDIRSSRRRTPRANQANYWYYCTEPAGYYPYVQNCSRNWLQVVPQNVPGAPGAPMPQ